MIDLHCHILPGIDDGAKSLDESVAMARTAVDSGIRVVAATPHISEAWPFSLTRPAELRQELNAKLERAGVPLSVVQGGELALDKSFEVEQPELARISLGGGSYVLLECAPTATPDMLERAVFHVQQRGFRVLLAHPERCAAVHNDPQILATLVGRGALSCVTASAFTGRFGRTVQRITEDMLLAGQVHCVASDAHSNGRRSPDLASWRQSLRRRAGDPTVLADWLTVDVPAAVLAGDDPPPRPTAVRQPRPWSPRRRSVAAFALAELA